MDHVIRIHETMTGRIGVYCSCATERLGDFSVTTLDELNRLAHEHIEAADRAPLIR